MERYLKESSPIKPPITEDSQEESNSIFRNSEIDNEEQKIPSVQYEDSKDIDKKGYADKTMTKSELAQGEQPGERQGTVEKVDESVDESKLSNEPEDGYKSKKLEINPIMKLDSVIGYTGKDLKWLPNINGKTVIYASGGLLVAMTIGKDQETNQRFFIGHTDIVT